MSRSSSSLSSILWQGSLGHHRWFFNQVNVKVSESVMNRQSSVCRTILQSLTMVPEKIPTLKFLTRLDARPTKNRNYLSWTRTRVAQFTLCMIFLMNTATIQHLNYSRWKSKQESKKHNLQFTFLTHSWSSHKVKVIKTALKMWAPSKVITKQSFKDLVLALSKKMATLKGLFVVVGF